MASDAGGGGVGGVGGGGGPKRLALPTITTTAPGSNQEKLSIPVSSHHRLNSLHNYHPHGDHSYDDRSHDFPFS